MAQRHEIRTWSNGDLVVYHGTIATSAASIQRDGVDVEHSRHFLDFGRGFYTTTNEYQATDWARKKAIQLGKDAAIVSFSLDRERFCTLKALWFVRGRWEDFRLFVEYCRAGGETHGRIGAAYDVVGGPVTTRLGTGIRTLDDSDQLSFHTEVAIALLNDSERAIILL